jgi:hypothetical protein
LTPRCWFRLTNLVNLLSAFKVGNLIKHVVQVLGVAGPNLHPVSPQSKLQKMPSFFLYALIALSPGGADLESEVSFLSPLCLT